MIFPDFKFSRPISSIVRGYFCAKSNILSLVYILVSGTRRDFWWDVNETKYARM